ncbi:hypothetical protein PVAP13_9KG249552 [Panicum virgatum]|uniref:Uncharacterized protein n=1 Tax=Panicum virgatum TaxID=38727 RepID=A0A8T0NQS1_PANVG|nr:hypothetical protein PVAP13_9KG249552 [Panicum virgatum]
MNKLRSLPSSVCEMTLLYLLDAHFNELCGLPSAHYRFLLLVRRSCCSDQDRQLFCRCLTNLYTCDL